MDGKDILILTSDLGFGHRSTARALADALELRFGPQARVTIANPLDDPRSPALLRNAEEGDYDTLACEWPEIYRLGYHLADTAITTNIKELGYIVLTYDLIARLMRRVQPDVVVTTFPTYQSPVDIFRRIHGWTTSLATIVTDLATLQRAWFYKGVDLCLLPTSVAACRAIEHGLPAERVRITGLPVYPALGNGHRSKEEARAALGWDPDRFTLLAVGSKRVDGLQRFLKALNHSGLDCQIVAVAGGNDQLAADLSSVEWRIPTTIYNYVHNMPEMLQAADCVLSKAGGLIVAESLACGLPLLLMQVIPGQETGNAQLVIDAGAGEKTLLPDAFVSALARWLAADRRLYHTRAANARLLGRPQAALDAADLIWELAHQPAAVPVSRAASSIKQVKHKLRQLTIPDTS